MLINDCDLSNQEHDDFCKALGKAATTTHTHIHAHTLLLLLLSCLTRIKNACGSCNGLLHTHTTWRIRVIESITFPTAAANSAPCVFIAIIII